MDKKLEKFVKLEFLVAVGNIVSYDRSVVFRSQNRWLGARGPVGPWARGPVGRVGFPNYGSELVGRWARAALVVFRTRNRWFSARGPVGPWAHGLRRWFCGRLL